MTDPERRSVTVETLAAAIEGGVSASELDWYAGEFVQGEDEAAHALAELIFAALPAEPTEPAGALDVERLAWENIELTASPVVAKTKNHSPQYRSTHTRGEPPLIDLDGIEMRFASQWSRSDDGQVRAWRDDIAALIDEVHRLRRVSSGYFEEMVRRTPDSEPRADSEGLDYLVLADALDIVAKRLNLVELDRLAGTIALEASKEYAALRREQPAAEQNRESRPGIEWTER